MTTDSLITIIGGIILLVLVIIAFAIRLKKNPTIADKDAAKEFLNGLSDTFYIKMINIINSIDITKYRSIEEFEIDVLNEIYDTVWDYVSAELEEASKTDILSALTLKVLDKDFVIKFINSMIQEKDISDNITKLWNSKFEKVVKDAVEQDKVLQSKFSSSEYNEDFDTKDLPPATGTLYGEDNEESVEDDEVEYDPESDDSVEELTDELVIKKDKNGNDLYYLSDKDGKLTRISKAEAEKYK